MRGSARTLRGKARALIFLGLSIACLSLACLTAGCAREGAEGGPAENEPAGTGDELAGDGPIGEGSGLVPIETVRETFAEEAEKVKGGEYDNIRFADAYFTFPEATEVFQLEYESEVTDFTCTPEEAYEYMCERVDELLPGMYDDEQKAEEIRFLDAEVSEERDPRETTDLRSFPDMRQYQEEDLVTERPLPEIANKDCYVELFNGVLRGYDRGDLAKLSGYDGRMDRFDAIQALPIEYRTLNLDSEKTFHLRSGDLSIAEAVRMADEYLQGLELSFRELPVAPRVQSVNVVRIDDSDFAFYFKVSTEYKKMWFAAFELDDSSISVLDVYNQTNETDFPGVATMCEEGDISRYRLMPLVEHSDVTETDSYDAVLPLGEAARIASDHLTDKMEFKALGVSAAYKSFAEKNDAQRGKKITVRPCWRFVLKPMTNDTAKLYHVFVDMITGEPYTFVQGMQSGVQYD